MKKVLIANRGEIAVRIIRACHDLGIYTVVVYSQADRESLPVLLADEAICIGPAPAKKSYLHVAAILSACEITHADAIHPGYGFLSENASFASICESCGIKFIGPSSKAISFLGNKAKAKALAKKVKCPVIPGTEGAVKDVHQGLKEARKIGFPLLIKASGGGGGKGIRVVEQEKDFVRNFTAASTEAEASFGNPEVYLEKMIPNPRHVEIQVLADEHGHYVHLGERDCSIQRRRQKLIEETPSPIVTSSMRKKMGYAAIQLLKAANYHSVATVEFLVDEKKNFYFMEVNTRIQVEHTITEEVTGIDLVKEQIKAARGEKLLLRQKDIVLKGHALQCRINAENPNQNFAPSPGTLKELLLPAGPHVRVDTACYAGYTIPSFYDSMIAKVITKASSREEAIAIMKRALHEFHISGIYSTIPVHQYLLTDPNFLQNHYSIQYMDQLLKSGQTFSESFHGEKN